MTTPAERCGPRASVRQRYGVTSCRVSMPSCVSYRSSSWMGSKGRRKRGVRSGPDHTYHAYAMVGDRHTPTPIHTTHRLADAERLGKVHLMKELRHLQRVRMLGAPLRQRGEEAGQQQWWCLSGRARRCASFRQAAPSPSSSASPPSDDDSPRLVPHPPETARSHARHQSRRSLIDSERALTCVRVF